MAVDPQTQSVLDALDALGAGAGAVSALDPAQARRQPWVADAVRAVLWEEGSTLTPEPVGATEELVIPVSGRLVPTRAYWPLGAEPGPLPVLVYGHGGSWGRGSLDAYDATPRAMANRAGCIVVSVEYGRAPEHSFAAMEETFVATIEWVLANMSQLSGDPSRVAVAGEGSGATVALAACQALRAKGSTQPRFVFLAYPFADPERRDWAPRLAPARASRSLLAGLPATLVVTAEHDPLRDEGEALGLLLADAGVDATTVRVEGVTHDFLVMNPVVDQAQHVISLAAQHLRAALGQRGPSAPTVGPDVAQVMAAQHAGMGALLDQLEAGRGDRRQVAAQLIGAVRAHAETAVLASDGDTSGTGICLDVEVVLGQLAEEPDADPDEAVGAIRAALDGLRVEQERTLAERRRSAGNDHMRKLGRRALAARQTAAPEGRETRETAAAG